jgi:hypothetical protein
MNPILRQALETRKRLRARSCVQRVVSLRLTISETELLIDALDKTHDDLKLETEVEIKQRLARAKAKAVQRGCYQQANSEFSSGTSAASE